MTNRQWLEKMSNKELAQFLTFGIMVRSINYHSDAFLIRIHDIARNYTSSACGIELWLSASQEYEIAKGGE